MKALATGRRARLIAVLTVTAVAGLGPGSALAASGGSDVSTVNTETVQTYLSADGEISSSRLYEQLTLTGDGTVDLKNPVDTDGLRNLNGFGGVGAKDGIVDKSYNVSGVTQDRSVSTFDTKKLPLSIAVTYVLDGKKVSADDLVGATGDVKVTYTAKNLTSKKIPLTFPDGTGGTTTAMGDVPVPLVGTVTFTLPKNFTDVKSQAASMGGDGHGGTQMQYLLTLFPPIGSTTVSFGYTAHLTDGLVPPVSFTAVPVDPLTNPTFATAASSYQSGADTGAKLADGATKINTNLLRLRDGAGQLLSGLIKLNDGAHQLSDGLSGQAAPGSKQLADGALELNRGLFKIDDGAGKLADGASQASGGGHQLADGAHRLSDGLGQAKGGSKQLDDGAGQLAAGQAQLEDGLTTLYNAVQGLPQSVQDALAQNPDYQSLLSALIIVANKIGTPTDTGTTTLLGAVNNIKGGVDLARSKLAAAGTSASGLSADASDLAAAIQDIDAQCSTSACSDAVTAAQGLATDLSVNVGGLATSLGAIDGVLAQLAPLFAGVSVGLSNGDPANCAAALETPDPSDNCGVKQVAQAIQAGVPTLVSQLVSTLQGQFLEGLGTPSKGCNPKKTLRCAARALTQGGRQLADGVDQLRAGILELSAGGTKLAAGAGQLSDGLDQLDSGSHQLADGTGQALDGSAQLADGAHQLSDGLSTASAGSNQLADGLQQARDGAPRLKNGATELSKRGVVKIVDAGKDTTQQYGKLYATLTEGAKRAHTDGMIYGAPTGSMGLMAYDFELNGSDGQGSRNVERLLLAVVLGGLGLGAFALRRRGVPFLPKA